MNFFVKGSEQEEKVLEMLHAIRIGLKELEEKPKRK